MGNAAWGAGHRTGLREGLAIGKAAGQKKGIAIGVVASVGVAAASVGLWKIAPWRLVSEHLLGREQDSAAMDSNPVAEKGVEDKQEAREGTPSE